MRKIVLGVAATVMALGMTAPAYAAKALKVHVNYTPVEVFNENFESGFGRFTKADGSNVTTLAGSAYQTNGNTFGGTGARLTNHYAAFGTGNTRPFAGEILAATINAASTGLVRYTLTFAAGVIGADVGSQFLSVTATGSGGGAFSKEIELIGSTNLDTALKNYKFTFDATGPLSLSFLGEGQRNDGSDTLLDNVTVTAGAVPEMATWGMMIVGFGAIGGTIRSRRRREKNQAGGAFAAA